MTPLDVLLAAAAASAAGLPMHVLLRGQLPAHARFVATLAALAGAAALALLLGPEAGLAAGLAAGAVALGASSLKLGEWGALGAAAGALVILPPVGLVALLAVLWALRSKSAHVAWGILAIGVAAVPAAELPGHATRALVLAIGTGFAVGARRLVRASALSPAARAWTGRALLFLPAIAVGILPFVAGRRLGPDAFLQAFSWAAGAIALAAAIALTLRGALLVLATRNDLKAPLAAGAAGAALGLVVVGPLALVLLLVPVALGAGAGALRAHPVARTTDG